MRLEVFEFDLSVPRDGYEIVIAGTELTVDICTGEAWIQLDSQDLDPIPLHRIGSVHNASFTKLYLSNRAQPGKFLRFYVGYGIQLSRTYLTIQDILRALEEEKELVNEFTSRDIIKKLVDENIVTSEMIKLRSLLEQHFSNGAVTGRVIADNSIEARHIQANSIESDHIVAGSIIGYHIAANSILSEHIVSGEITSDHIQANAIQANHIAAGAILSGHIAVGSIRSEHIVSKAIRAEHIFTGAISADHIHANSITVDKLESTLYGNLMQYFSVLRAHLTGNESITYLLTDGIFNSGTASNCYIVYESGYYHIYVGTSVTWDNENAHWDNSSITWDIPLPSGYWISDVFDAINVLTGIVSVRFNSDAGNSKVYVSRSIDGNTWSNWEELNPFLFLDSITHQTTITEFRYFKVRIELTGFAHLYNIQISVLTAELNADTLNGYHISSFVLKNEPTTITAVHTFNPTTVSAPFVLGTNAQGQLVIGLNADMVDGQHASEFATATHNHDTTYVRKGTADTITAVHTFNPSSAGAPFILGANAQGQLVTGLNADTVDGIHVTDLAKKEESFFGNGNVTFTYNNDRIAQMTGSCGSTNMTVTLSYVNSGLVSHAAYTINGVTTTYSFTYTNGRISQITASRN